MQYQWGDMMPIIPNAKPTDFDGDSHRKAAA